MLVSSTAASCFLSPSKQHGLQQGMLHAGSWFLGLGPALLSIDMLLLELQAAAGLPVLGSWDPVFVLAAC